MDQVIVGQGLAGTTLAWSLLDRGQDVLVVDRGHGGSSRVAAGLMTPVTGQRVTPSWRLDELWPAAVGFYRAMESRLGRTLIHDRQTVRLFRDERERQRFERRLDAIKLLVQPLQDLPELKLLRNTQGGFVLPASAQLDVSAFLDASREAFRRMDRYRQVDLDCPRDFCLEPDHVRIERLGIQARCVVFCRGFADGRHPWFEGIRFDATKGQILTVSIPDFSSTRVINRGIWIAPGPRGLHRVGATTERQPLDDCVTAVGRDELTDALQALLSCEFQIRDHSAGVRPIVVGRHPVIGRHPRWPQLAFFNGLGSKGSLQAPFFAGQLAESLCSGGEIDPEVELSQRWKESR